MPDLRCSNCNYLISSGPVDEDFALVCPNPNCKKHLLIYKCFSCMKASVLEIKSLPQTCPRCFTILRTNRPLNLKPYDPITPKVKTFASFEQWRGAMIKLVGVDTWIVVGGYAAYMRIFNYADCDQSFLNSNLKLLLPGDLEIETTQEAEKIYRKKYEQTFFMLGEKKMVVTLFPQIPERFSDHLQDSDALEMCRVFKANMVINMYKIGGDVSKAEKREFRSKLLTLIVRKQRIDQESVSQLGAMIGKPMLGALNLKNPMANLRPVKKDPEKKTDTDKNF